MEASLCVILKQSSDGNLAGDKLHHGFEVFTSSGKTTFVWRRKCISGVQASQVAYEIETMTFASQLGTAVVLVTLTLWLQCLGIAVLIHWVRASIERGVARLSTLHGAILMIRFSILVIVLHFVQIFFWSVFYRWHCLSSWESSFYFSATSYSTVGYGDIVLPRVWRLLGPVESVTGVLMCGISISFLFVVATKLVERESGTQRMQCVNRFEGRSEAEVGNIF